jgi:hypothetical protein
MDADHEVVRLAELRNGLVRVDDLRLLGLSRAQIRRRITRAELFVVHPGVLSRRPPPLDFEARAVAVCLAYPSGVLSFSAAAHFHRIRRVPREWLDLTVTGCVNVHLPDVHVHYTKDLPQGDVIHWINGLRLTTPARTLFDLASVLDGPALRSAIDDARHRSLVTDLDLETIGSRLLRRGRPGSVLYRSVIGSLVGSPPVASHYEVVVLDALRAAGLRPAPCHQLSLPNGRRIVLDLALLESRIDIEIDPGFTHASPAAIAADKARDVQTSLLGWQVVRFSEDDVERRLRSVVGYVRALDLQRRAA